ncbi:hypothetical protein LGN43_30200, partial [Burkholderia multivorans]|uniref:hypothetical protein n=1 Tax=Burkholderia multivorans TaxID=87883 RepID=UPI001C247E26
LQASLGFLQDADDLLFGESLFHCRSSLERTLHRHRTKRGEQVMGRLMIRQSFERSSKLRMHSARRARRLSET